MEKDEIISYHVFCDGYDEHVGTYKEALEIYRQWIRKGEKRVRIYKNTSYHSKPDEFVEEEFIKGHGDFPY